MDKVKDLEKEFIDLYLNDDQIHGIFISGSLANDSYDEYSDVDIRFLISGTDISAYLVSFAAKIQQLNHKVLFFEPCYFKNAVIPHFDNFIKADVFFYTNQMLQPTAWLKDIKIIKDQDSFLYHIKKESKAQSFLPNISSINMEILKFFANSHECFRRIKRGEYLYADYLLDSMKLTIINFHDFINNNASIGWYKIEKRFDRQFVRIINDRIKGTDDDLKTLASINSMFIDCEKKLCEKYNILRNIKKDTDILSYYME